MSTELESGTETRFLSSNFLPLIIKNVSAWQVNRSERVTVSLKKKKKLSKRRLFTHLWMFHSGFLKSDLDWTSFQVTDVFVFSVFTCVDSDVPPGTVTTLLLCPVDICVFTLAWMSRQVLAAMTKSFKWVFCVMYSRGTLCPRSSHL